MPRYVKKVLKRYRHNAPQRKQDYPYQPPPHTHTQQYSPQSQILPKDDPGTPLDDQGEQYIRQVVGSLLLLYYARAMDVTILFALSTIAQEHANPTEKTMQYFKQPLDYMHSNPMVKI